MGWKMTEPARAVAATRKLIDEFVNMEPAPGDRNLVDRRTDWHRQQIAAGTFRVPEWASVFCKETNKTYRVNGKHTSLLFAALNGELPSGQQVFLERFEADTLNDVASLYATFDARQCLRTGGDINKSFQMSSDTLAHLPLRVFTLAASAIAYAAHEDAYHINMPSHARAQAALDDPGFVLWLNEAVSGSSEARKNLMRTGVAAAMYRTWKKSHQAATTFWAAVRDETGERPTLPDRIIAKFIASVSVMSFAKTGKKSVGTREIYVKCIHAWNAWRRGDDLGHLKYTPSVKTPPVA